MRSCRPAVLVVALAISACTGIGGSPSPSGGPDGSPVPTSSPVGGGIEHPTGANELVLRFEQGGGFVPLGWLVTEGPIFSLYGDGTAIFRDPATTPPPAIGGVTPGAPYQIVRLTEDQVQALLAFAVGPGGLGVAGPHYDPGTVIDAPTATFTIVAGGLRKQVSVVALGFDNPQSADAGILKALASLGTRLQGFGLDVVGERPWTPDRYRGILMDDAFSPPVVWPWPAIEPDDFTSPADPNRPFFQTRVMTPAEVELLGIDGFEGGFQGLALTAPSGKVYSFALRPLLPDEAS